MADVGQLFAPFAQLDQQQNGAVGSQDLTTPAQEVIKLLSLRFPRYVGASAPAPSKLLGGRTPIGGALQGGVAQTQLGHSIGDSIADRYLQSLFSGQMAPDMGGSGGSGNDILSNLPVSFDFEHQPNTQDVFMPPQDQAYPPTPQGPQEPAGSINQRRKA